MISKDVHPADNRDLIELHAGKAKLNVSKSDDASVACHCAIAQCLCDKQGVVRREALSTLANASIYFLGKARGMGPLGPPWTSERNSRILRER